jgi:hypothetical protein
MANKQHQSTALNFESTMPIPSVVTRSSKSEKIWVMGHKIFLKNCTCKKKPGISSKFPNVTTGVRKKEHP